MTEPKTDARLRVELDVFEGMPAGGGDVRVLFFLDDGTEPADWADLDPSVFAALKSVLAENAGLREALDLTESAQRMAAELLRLNEAMRPIVDAAVEITSSGDMPTTLMWVRLATAVDSYAQTSNPAPKGTP